MVIALKRSWTACSPWSSNSRPLPAKLNGGVAASSVPRGSPAGPGADVSNTNVSRSWVGVEAITRSTSRSEGSSPDWLDTEQAPPDATGDAPAEGVAADAAGSDGDAVAALDGGVVDPSASGVVGLGVDAHPAT